jgi:site-specific DNA-cytosine methylase
MELLGLEDFIISGWDCQGFLTIGFGIGLNDTRSDVFMNMV